MAKVLSISIFKGGTGKTTTAVALASCLAQMDNKVLLIDLDQQATSTRYVGLDPEQENPNLYHLFKQVPASLAVKDTNFKFKIIPGNSLLAVIEEMLEVGKDENILKDLIEGIKQEFDYVILDSPPGKAMLAKIALVAADEVIIPLQAERPALDGVQDLLRFIQDIVWEKCNSSLKIGGILPTMFKRTTTHSAGVIKKAREIWGDKVFDVEIPEAIAFPRSFDQSTPLPNLDPNHDGSKAYNTLAKIIHEKR